MQATGTLTLAKTGLLATTATDGTFVLTLLAHDRFNDHQAVPYRITWCGMEAKRFWLENHSLMKPGQPISVTLTRLWALGNSRFGAPEIHATVTEIGIPAPQPQSEQPQAG